MKTSEETPTVPVSAPLRRDALLSEHLRAQGLRADVVVTRADGAPMTDADHRAAAAALKVFTALDRKVYADWKTRTATKPARTAREASKPRARSAAAPRAARTASTRAR